MDWRVLVYYAMLVLPTVAAVVVYAKYRWNASRVLFAWAIVWFFTAWIWGPVMGHIFNRKVVNRAGNHWFTDAWNPIVPDMNTWRWTLVAVALVFGLVAMFFRRGSTTRRIVLSLAGLF